MKFSKEYVKERWGILTLAAISLLPIVVALLWFLVRAVIENPLIILAGLWYICLMLTMNNLFNGRFSK